MNSTALEDAVIVKSQESKYLFIHTCILGTVLNMIRVAYSHD